MPWLRSTPSIRNEATAPGDRLASAVVAELVGRAKRGDGEAFADLYDHYVGEIYAFVAVRLSDQEAAEDATQTIFVRALHSLSSCREDAAFPGWLFAIARNIITDTYRANRFRPDSRGSRRAARRRSPSTGGARALPLNGRAGTVRPAPH